ncbi:MAG TPA: phage/plasmid primase, P4 family [Acidimicrobiales bacterium]|nr:phage/plasmid primase, P4 family [Acidimicrobiales bacterium]
MTPPSRQSEARPGPGPTTDLGNARRFARQYHDTVRYVPEWETWLRWDGTRWAPDRCNRALELGCEIPRLVLAEAQATRAQDARTRLTKWALASESASRIQAALSLAKADRRLVVTPERLDAYPHLLNTRSGTVDLRTGEVHDHDPAELHTRCTGVGLERGDRWPSRFLAFLERILPQPDVRAFVQRAIGYSATASVAEQVMVIAYGPGANGKSTLHNVLQLVLGDYAHQAAPDLLLTKRHDTHPTEVAALRGRRLVVATETNEGRRLDSALVKRLTGGDPISARFMRQDFFEFVPSHKLWLACNHLPRVADHSPAMWRRIRLVPFTVSIPAEERVPDLDRQLVAEEGPAILAWIVEGALAWRDQGLDPPPDVMLATETYRQTEDHVEQALDDVTVTGDGAAWESSKEIIDAYTRWCADNAIPEHQRVTAKALTDRLTARGATPDRRKVSGRTVRGWRGICLANRIPGGDPW